MNKPQDFEGRVALVTGSATGLGAAMAIELASRGATVIVNYTRSREEAEATAAACAQVGPKAILAQGDVGEPDDCRRLVAEAEALGRLDVLINNAGITKMAPNHGDLDALSKDDFLRLYAVNTVGPYLMVQAARPLLDRTAETAGRASAVLNVSSIAGVAGIGSSVAYAATKGALNTMTLSLARALAPKIRVNALCPGFIGTRWFRDALGENGFAGLQDRMRASTPLGVASGPDDIGEAGVFLVSDAARHITGEMLLVDAGSHLNFTPLSAR